MNGKKISILVMAVVCLVTSSANANDPYKAPEIPAVDPTLPLPLQVPSEVQCKVGDKDLTGGVYMDPKLDAFTHGRLLMLDAYPDRAQVRLDVVKKMCKAEVQGAYDITFADCGAKMVTKEVEIQSGWQWWHVTLVGVGALTVGVVLGLAAGFTASAVLHNQGS